MFNLGLITVASGDYAEGRQLLEESPIKRRDMGEKWRTAFSLAKLGMITLTEGDQAEARALFEESLALCEGMDDKPIMAYASLGLGLATLNIADPAAIGEARQRVAESLRLRQAMGEQRPLTSSLTGMARLLLYEGDVSRAS